MVLLFQAFGLLEFILKVGIVWLKGTKVGQCSYRVVVLFNQILTLTAEEERFWMVRSHVLDLLGDGDYRLVLLHLKLADAEIGETS